MKVLALTRYGVRGASSRLRTLQYLPHLQRKGVEVVVSPFFGDEYLEALYSGQGRRLLHVATAYIRRLRHLLTRERFDVLWIEYESLPWMPFLAEQLFCRSGVPYVVDYDDAIFHRYDRHPSRLVRRALGNKIDRLMQGAALVVAGNEYLAQHAREAGAKRVAVVPTVVDLERYAEEPPAPSGPFTIGWIGSPATGGYLDLVRPALHRLCSDADAQVLLVGVGPSALDGLPGAVRPWSEATEVQNLRAFDVGIMPLPDEPWARGKCGYKLIQYMACGKPVVASPVGVNREIIRHGTHGFLASTADEWHRAIAALKEDARLCRRMGEAGRRRVESDYCLAVTAPRLLELLHSAVPNAA
jgi:glycosyltransferase involved in cell wall biosynthesis